MQTITVNVYTVHELREQHPDGFERAHRWFLEDFWLWCGLEEIGSALNDVEADEGSPFGGRFIEWDADRVYAHYADGDLTGTERTAVRKMFPGLTDASEMRIDGNAFYASFYGDDKDEPAFLDDVAGVNNYLSLLYVKFRLAMEMEYDHVTSPDYFVDVAEANGWTFEANGEMRNV
jgi:hypothetical protein